ncbi:hypothetical protein LCGC14_2530800 [marine sediment metagenome]|uniref:RNA polymerase sigma-70 region 2 domain-containing protein n=1 Tax=marine sediment metagenome TaxID=412755 RepID=A0A0F9DLT8_9ZZZZ
MMDDTRLPSEMPYQELETQWLGMLRRFTWNIDGMEREDVLQELRIVLMLAQKKYDPTLGYAFSTYLWRACLNRVGKLLHQTREVKRRVPVRLIFPLCDGEHGGEDRRGYCSTCLGLPKYNDDVEIMELLSNVSQESLMIAGLILRGESTRQSWELRGMNPEQIKEGVAGLKALLKGGRDGKEN